MGRTRDALIIAVGAALLWGGTLAVARAQQDGVDVESGEPASSGSQDTEPADRQVKLPPRARLLLTDCKDGPFDRKVFVEVLRLELASHDIDMPKPRAGAEWTDDDARISVDSKSCRKTGRSADIEVEHVGTGREASRSVVFTFADPKGRARVLAIAVAEFVLLHWERLSTEPTTRDDDLADLRARLVMQEQELARVATIRSRTTEYVAPKWILAVGPAVDWFLEYSSATLGPGVVASVGVHDNVRLELGAEAGLGRSRALAGNIKLRTFSAGLTALFGGGDRVWLGAGPHLSAGWLRVRGDVRDNITLAVETSTEDRVTGAAGVQFGMRALLKGRWWLLIDGRFAYGFRRVGGQADEGVRGGIGGSTMRLGAAIGVSL